VTEVCDAWPVRRQTYGYLSSRRASPPLHRSQIVLLDDRGTYGSPYSIAERGGSESDLGSFGSQPAGDVSHKPGGRLPLLSARPAVTIATLKRAATNFAAW